VRQSRGKLERIRRPDAVCGTQLCCHPKLVPVQVNELQSTASCKQVLVLLRQRQVSGALWHHEHHEHLEQSGRRGHQLAFSAKGLLKQGGDQGKEVRVFLYEVDKDGPARP
jgi:hypothetical protein